MDIRPETVRRPLLVTSSPDEAEEWAEILDRAGLDVLIEITDAQVGEPGRSALIGVLGARPPGFVHLVTIPPTQRDDAIAALVDAGWDGREGLYGGRGALDERPASVRSMLVAALCVLGAIAAFIMLRTAIG